MIEVSKLNKSYGSFQALKDIDLQVASGEVVVVLGPSGSGKSTLIRCMNLLESFESGSICINKHLVQKGKGLSTIRSDVGMVFQSFNLFPHMTARANVALAPMRVRKLSRASAESRADALLAKVGLADQADKLPSQLSGGQQQRVAIARALAMEPKVLLFDEPTSALDPEMVGEVLDVMQALVKTGVTMVVVTHEMGFARRVADRVVFMESGRVVEINTPGEFFTAPRQERSKVFLDAILHH
ncbi:MAG: amino acid ABC transporter ATP-binding protein [Polaromonas sp.]